MMLTKFVKKLKRILKASIGKGKKLLPSLCFKTFCILPVRKDIAVFESYRGESFSGNPKYILLEIQKRKSIRCIAFVNNPTVYQNDYQNIRFVKRLSVEYIYWLARAKYVVNNVNYPDFLQKREGTYHVQTMHGTPLKLMGSDLISKTNYAYKQNLLGLFNRSKRWDLLVSPNQYTTEIFTRVFRYRGDVLECGYPRNDILVNNVNNDVMKSEMKAKLGLDADKKVILFAPTWRESSSNVDIESSLNIDFQALKDELSHEYVVILRLHHLVSDNLDVSDYEGFIYDLSDYPDSQELLIATDLLVTDYSSIMFDYLNYKKTLVLYLHDYDEYMEDRGAYFDIRKSSPGKIAYNFEELLKILATPDLNLDCNQEVYDKFCHAETGTASKQVVERMLER